MIRIHVETSAGLAQWYLNKDRGRVFALISTSLVQLLIESLSVNLTFYQFSACKPPPPRQKKIMMAQGCRSLPGNVPRGWVRFHYDLSAFNSDG